jgi:predicted enzyme related to lactoylglutathione lyase
MNTDKIRIDYLEFLATDIERTKRFYGEVFGWTFEDYGPDYAAFDCGNLKGGFARADAVHHGGPLVVLFAQDLASIRQRVIYAGGPILKPPFDFPGGRRFHFADLNGNELAVWSDQ